MQHSTLQSYKDPPQCHSPILLIGAAHSGKSILAGAFMDPALPTAVIGTADPTDKMFETRLQELRASRPRHWTHVEGPGDACAAMRNAAAEYPQIIFDAASQWVATMLVRDSARYDLEQMEARLAAEFAEITHILAKTSSRVVVVTNEVGAGTTPPAALERLYRQQTGRLNTQLARACRTVFLVAAGLHVQMKG